MALIALEGMHFHAFHGFYEEEQIIGNHFYLDVYINASIAGAAVSGDLFATVNYETVYLICQAEMRKPTRLLETLAWTIAQRLKEHFDRVQGVRVRVRKMNPPLGGTVQSAYVEYETGSMGDGKSIKGDLFDF